MFMDKYESFQLLDRDNNFCGTVESKNAFSLYSCEDFEFMGIVFFDKNFTEIIKNWMDWKMPITLTITNGDMCDFSQKGKTRSDYETIYLQKLEPYLNQGKEHQTNILRVSRDSFSIIQQNAMRF